MTPARRFPGSACAAAFAVLVGAALAGCSERPASPPPASDEAPAETSAAAGDVQIDTYTVRGEIEELPEPGRPMSALRIHHEAIDNFVNRAGKVVGMGSMTMEFPVAEGVSLEGLAVGQKVEFTFAMARTPTGGYRVTAIRPLPDETVLEFRKARPPAAAPETGG